jgi:hypothetical protein
MIKRQLHRRLKELGEISFSERKLIKIKIYVKITHKANTNQPKPNFSSKIALKSAKCNGPSVNS